MMDLFSYLDYRKYLRERFQREKETSSFFSYRYIGQRTGIDSGQLAKILQGQLHLSDNRIPTMCSFLKFTPQEAEYFETLIHFNKAKNEQQIKTFFEKILSFREVNPSILNVEQYAFYQNWYTIAIYVLLDFYPFSGNYKHLASRLVPQITSKQAKESIELLTKLGLITQLETGRYILTQKHISTPDTWKSMAILQYQQNTVELAMQAFNGIPKQHRHCTTLTLSANQDALETIRVLTEEYRRSVMKVVEECDEATVVFQLNTQFFPLSQWETHTPLEVTS